MFQGTVLDARNNNKEERCCLYLRDAYNLVGDTDKSIDKFNRLQESVFIGISNGCDLKRREYSHLETPELK